MDQGLILGIDYLIVALDTFLTRNQKFNWIKRQSWSKPKKTKLESFWKLCSLINERRYLWSKGMLHKRWINCFFLPFPIWLARGWLSYLCAYITSSLSIFFVQLDFDLELVKSEHTYLYHHLANLMDKYTNKQFIYLLHSIPWLHK